MLAAILTGILILAMAIFSHAMWQKSRGLQRRLDALPDAMLLASRQGAIRYVNAQLCALSGCSAEQLLALTLDELLPIGEEAHSPVWHSLFAPGQHQVHGSLGLRLLHFPGQEARKCQIEVASLPQDGEVILILREPDIQHVDQPESYLAQKLLNTAEQDGGIGSWVLETASGKLHWSEQVHRIFGTDASQFVATEQAYFERVHPDDRQRVRSELDRLMVLGKPFDLEYRIVRPDGSIRHLLERNHMHAQADGHIDHLWGTVLDMTSQKQLQQQLQLARLAVEYSSEAIAIADSRMQWLFLNPAFCRMVGRSESLLRQQAPAFMLPGSEVVLAAADLGRLVDGEEKWRGELRIAREAGSPLPVLASVSQIDSADLGRLQVWVLTDISRIKESERQLKSLAFFDGLTGVANRTLFSQQLQRLIDEDQPFALVFADLNGFKLVNDKLGHQAGDGVLQQMASQLQQSLHSGELLGRWGGDEFALLLPDCVSVEALTRRLSDLRSQALVERFDKGLSVQVSASFGVCCYPQAGRNRDRLLHQADQAMYRAKAQGPHAVWLHDGHALHSLLSSPARSLPAGPK